MNREETKQDELILIKNVGYFHPDLLGIKMGDTGESVADDNNVPVKQPDPITGLVPCGCGGVAKLYHRHSTILPKQILWVVQCVKFGKCGISTPDCTRKQDAIALWNLAMGYRA